MPGSDSTITRSASPLDDRVAVVGQQPLAVPERDLERQVVARIAGRRAPRSRSRSPRRAASSGACRCRCGRPAPATRSARCRSCADTRSSAARAASPACRAAWSGRAGRPRRGTVTGLRPEGASRAVMSAENGVYPPSWLAASEPLTQTLGRVVDRAEVQDHAAVVRPVAARTRARTSRRGGSRGRRCRWPPIPAGTARRSSCGQSTEGGGMVVQPLVVEAEAPGTVQTIPIRPVRAADAGRGCRSRPSGAVSGKACAAPARASPAGMAPACDAPRGND